MIMNVNNEEESVSKPKRFLSENAVKAVFISSIAGISAIASFAYAFGSTKKKETTNLDVVTPQTYESASQLAFRALRWGTFYAFTGCGLIWFTIWKLSGAKTKEEFRLKIGSLFPKVPKNVPQGRTDFESVSDFLHYLNYEYSTPKTTDSSNKPPIR